MDVTRVIIDTDPGVDDAIAILVALASPELDVVALTTVAGNVGLDQTTRNARRLVDLAQRPEVVVAAGSARALGGATPDASEVHGRDGLGDLDWAEPGAGVADLDAVEVLRSSIERGPLTVIAIGPLTNLAVLLRRYPSVAGLVERVVVMGGASFAGNVTPAAEFNIWADPEAAREVFAAPWPLTILPLDLTHQARLNDEDLAYLRGLGSEVGRRCADMLEPYARFHETWYGTRDVIMHDATAVYEVLRPGAITTEGVEVRVETGGEYSRGATWFDRRREHRDASTRVGVALDNATFVSLVRERLARY